MIALGNREIVEEKFPFSQNYFHQVWKFPKYFFDRRAPRGLNRALGQDTIKVSRLVNYGLWNYVPRGPFQLQIS